MHLYSFVNHYLSPLQQGIHTAHCVAAMTDEAGSHALFIDWAGSHKTIDVRVGGDARMLDDILARLYTYSEKFGLPLVRSYEDGDPANEKLTAVAILAPEWAYSAELKRDGNVWVWNHSHLNTDVDMPSSMSFHEGTVEFEFISLLNSMPKA